MQLQKAATGVLGWFGLKTTGRNPFQFGDSLLPVAEVGDNYLLQGELGTETLTGTNMAIGTSAAPGMIITVPANKVYRVLSIGVDLGLAAADTAFITDWYAYVTNINGSVSCFIAAGRTDLVGNPGGAARVGAFYLPRPLTLAPGSSINFFQRSNTNLTVAASQHAYMLRAAIDA